MHYLDAKNERFQNLRFNDDFMPYSQLMLLFVGQISVTLTVKNYKHLECCLNTCPEINVKHVIYIQKYMNKNHIFKC